MRRLRGGIILTTLLIVTAVIFASGAVAVYTVFMKPEVKSQVPNLKGLTNVDAVAHAERLGLVVQIEQTASTMPSGTVLAQSPEEGTELRKGNVIVLQVSKGGELHDVPNVQGMTLTDAQAEIKAQGFALGDVVRIRERNIKAGEVIAQSPSSPAQVSAGRKIDLLVQDGADASGVVTVPDVNRMTEKEARDVRGYSALLPEGLAIETRPGKGSTMRAGQGVILKLATQRRPAGYMDAKSDTTSNANGTARRVTSQQSQTQTQEQTTQPRTAQTQTPTPTQTAQTPPVTQQEEFIGDDYVTPSTPSKPSAPSTTASTPSTPQQPASSGGNKTASIRYIVPPIARPMSLKIEVTDPSGKRDILSRQVSSGESVSASARYTKECMITIYLGGEVVWQEKKN